MTVLQVPRLSSYGTPRSGPLGDPERDRDCRHPDTEFPEKGVPSVSSLSRLRTPLQHTPHPGAGTTGERPALPNLRALRNVEEFLLDLKRQVEGVQVVLPLHQRHYDLLQQQVQLILRPYLLPYTNLVSSAGQKSGRLTGPTHYPVWVTHGRCKIRGVFGRETRSVVGVLHSLSVRGNDVLRVTGSVLGWVRTTGGVSVDDAA